MISEFLMKGIDNLFTRGRPTISNNPQTKFFNKETIKANLQSVVKEGPIKPHKKETIPSNLTKSRLRSILEKDKEAQIKSVVRKDNSRNLSPYQKISATPNATPNVSPNANSPHKR
jgi:hypothetical protein